MKKIIIIGSGGAGKSTVARRLGEILNIEIVHLDKLYWQADWVEPPRNEWEKTVEKLLKKDAWIMDGNFGGTMEMRFEACDTVIWLDLSPALCVFRALKRNLKYYNRTRPDMGANCPEKFDLDFLWWILTFKRSKSGFKLKMLVEKFKNTKNIVRLKSTREVENFFVNLEKNKVNSQ